MAMANFLKKEQLDIVFHRKSATSGRDDLSHLLKLGADPFWRDENGVSCIETAYYNQNGKLQIRTNLMLLY